MGGMFGYGLDEEVIQAYQWLIENYAHDDHIFIFGFSRGAFVPGVCRAFISKCGLLKPGSSYFAQAALRPLSEGLDGSHNQRAQEHTG